MMKSMYLMSSKYTTSFVRYVVLLFSLLTLGLGSAWGQEYKETILFEGNFERGNNDSKLEVSVSEYPQDNNGIVRFTFKAKQSFQGSYGLGGLVKQGSWMTGEGSNDRSYYVSLDISNAVPSSKINTGDLFYINVSVEEFRKVANNSNSNGTAKNVLIDVWNVVYITQVALLVPNPDPFIGAEPNASTPKTLIVNRSATSVAISEDLKSENITAKYARFYLTDANDTAIDPTGKLMVKYGNDNATLCPIPEKGFYISADNFDKSNIDVSLEAPKAYKLYKVVCLFSNEAPTKDNNGNITREPDFNLQYTYNFTYEDLVATETKDFKDTTVEWKLNGMTPSVSTNDPDEWGTSSEELAVERYVKWYVVKGDDVTALPLEEYTEGRLEEKWTISDYLVSENVATKVMHGEFFFPTGTIYAPAGKVYDDVKDCKIVCEIYANSTGNGYPNARYTFSLKKEFLGELKDPTRRSLEMMKLENGEVTTMQLQLNKVKQAWSEKENIKYARIWLTQADGTMVDPSSRLTVSGDGVVHQYRTEGNTTVTYGYYLTGNNVLLDNITVSLNLPRGTYNQYRVHVALSKDPLTSSMDFEPDYDYLYTFSFSYPWKTRYKTLIIDDVNNPHVTPFLISNWFELAGDCGVERDELANNLYVRWYLTDENDNEIPVSSLKPENDNNGVYTIVPNRGFYGNSFSSASYTYNPTNNNNFYVTASDRFGNTGDNGYYKVQFTLWNKDLPDNKTYKDVRLVCVATTKGKDFNDSDPDIQVKYIYTLKLKNGQNDDLKQFVHYEGEAYRYLKEIGDDNQAESYDYIKVKGNAPDNNYTWNLQTNDYNNTTDVRNIRQNVHTVDYYYYVKPGQQGTNLILPLQNYTRNGGGAEPRAYFRWYDYQTDRKSPYLNKNGSSLEEIGDFGLFAFKTGDPNHGNIGVTFNAPDNFSEIQIACDVSRYMDGMDESFTYLVHEPTISVRYLFHIRPASEIAKEIETKANSNKVTEKATGLTAVEERIANGGKPVLLEDEGRTVISTNKGYGEFALRTKLSDLGLYYVKNGNAFEQAQSLWWYAYYYDGSQWWRHLVPNKIYKDRDGNVSKDWTKNDHPIIYRAQTYQAKYSLETKQWPDDHRRDGNNYNDVVQEGKEDIGDFDGFWVPFVDGKFDDGKAEDKGALIKVGDRVQMVACVSTGEGGQNVNAPIGTIMPIIWTELEFIDAKPLTLDNIKNMSNESADWVRTTNYMNIEYNHANTLDFNEFSLLGKSIPTHSYENYAPVPLQYPNAQYGFIYPQLYGYCATMRLLGWNNPAGHFGMAAMHGDYTLLKSMGMPGISQDKDYKLNPNYGNGRPLILGYTRQSIQVDWVNEGTLYDVTHESTDKKEVTDSENYGGFIYVDAADEARTIASLEFDAKLCHGAKIYYTAYVASMTGLTRPQDFNSDGSVSYNTGTPQTAPSLRFRVSTKDDNGERVPVVTFVTGNIRQEVNYNPVTKEESAYNNNNCPFQEATWYQVYGYATIPSELSNLLTGKNRKYFVEIDNYCDNTDGADYCVDQISFYTSNCRLQVTQAASRNCDEYGTSLNIYVDSKELQEYNPSHIYWRICDENGNPVTDPVLYGDFLTKTEYTIPFGVTPVPQLSGDINNLIPQLHLGSDSNNEEDLYGYFKKSLDDEIIYFSLVNKHFDLVEGENYYISVYKLDGEPATGDEDDWGNIKDVCTVYSPVFIPKRVYVSVSDQEGNSNPSIEVSCSDHVANPSQLQINMVVNVPDEKQESGFYQSKEKIAFDFFIGTEEEYNSYNIKLSEEGAEWHLNDAIQHYRGRSANNITWIHDQEGLDDSYKDFCDNEQNKNYYEGYYYVIQKAVEDGLLYLLASDELNLKIDINHATILALAINKKVKNSQDHEYEICTPLPLTFDVKDNLEDPSMMLGFRDVTYANNLRVIRVGKKQLKDMQAADGYLLHIPVKKYQANKDAQENEGTLQITSGYLELLAYSDNGTDDPTIKENVNVAIFGEIVISNDKNYISLNFHQGSEEMTKYDFKEGFTYRMFFQVKNGSKLNDPKACEADVEFLMKVVPEYVTWNDGSDNGEGKVTGTNQNENTNWNNDKNWSRSRKAELYKNDSQYEDNSEIFKDVEDYKGTPATFVPMKFTYVTIPSGNKAPELVKLTRRTTDDIIENINNNQNQNLATDSIEYDLMVKIENTCEHNGTGSVYDCEKFYGNICKEIYFKPNAELINQQFLTYGKAWVEKELVANKWYLMSTPLKATYAGDMYVPYHAGDATKNGRQETEAFLPITFGTTYSRTKYPIYQRSWGTAHASKVIVSENDAFRSDYSAALGYTTWSGNIAEWGHTFNDVDVDYTTMTGFSIRAHKKDQKNGNVDVPALIRLPKEDTSYQYYDYNDGTEQDGKSSTFSKISTDIGKFVTTQNDANVTLRISNAQQMGGYILVGNPYMASLDMEKFFEGNAGLEKAYYTYDESKALTHEETGVIRPLQAFFVKQKDNTLPNATITFTDAMMMDGNSVDNNNTMPAPAMRMTASNERGQSMATVSLGEETKSVETLFDSNLEDVPVVYTVADGQAVSIHQVTELNKPIAFGVTCAASDELVEVTFSDVAQLTNGDVYVVDAVTGEQTAVGEGSTLSLQPNDYGRYYLLAGTTDITDKVDMQKGIMVSVRGREVTVTSGEELTQVHALSLTGATIYQDSARSTTASFSLPSGVYIIQAENVAGEQQTVKVIVR